ncbi:MAG: Dabb family protein [Proteobacteria bacterium]|nr:Dabb family protein [Pseudomonadota bacterium]
MKHLNNGYYHVVLFRFECPEKTHEVNEHITTFLELQNIIIEIDFSITSFDKISDEDLDQGYKHGFLLMFNSKKDYETYYNHYAHQEFVKYISQYITRVQGAFVFDFSI